MHAKRVQKRAASYNIAKQFSFLINLTLSKEEIQQDVGQLIKSINHIQNMLTCMRKAFYEKSQGKPYNCLLCYVQSY